MEQKTLSAAILAGGKRAGTGESAALRKYQELGFVHRIYRELSIFDEVLISASEKGVYEEIGCRVVYDEHTDIGAIEGIYQSIRASKGEYVFICASDMPFIKKELAAYMAEFISSDYDCYCLKDDSQVYPLCAIYSKKLLPLLEELIAQGRYRLIDILYAARTKYIRLETSCFDKQVVKNVYVRPADIKPSLPVVFCVSGVKDSGKTGLIIRLINEFIQEDYRVAVIKHDGHEYEMDHQGTDTYRISKAGAVDTIIYSKSQYSVNHRGEAKLEHLIKCCTDADIIILEGQKYSDYPKVEVVRRAVSDHTVCDPATLICAATDADSLEGVFCPVYELDDTRGVFLCIKKFFGLESES